MFRALMSMLAYVAIVFVYSQEVSADQIQTGCDEAQHLALQDKQGFRVSYLRYAHPSQLEGDGSVIVILPPTGGVSTLDRNWGKMFCRAGYVALVIEEYTGSFEKSLDLGVHQRVMGSAVNAFRLIRKRYPSEFFGIFGTSAGGILTASLVENLRGDLDAIFLVVAGAPLHSVIARSQQSGLRRLRERRMEHFGFETIEEYEEAILSKLKVSVPQVPPSGLRIGMAIALKDTVVPTIYQETLAGWWVPTEMIRLDRNHLSAVGVVSARHREKILKFFNSAAGF